MAKSELMINIGADGSKAKKEIREVKREGVSAAEEIQAKNNEATKSAIGMIAPMAIAVQALMSLIGGISESIRKYMAAGDVFVEWGKKAEISAHSVAYLKAQADAAGVSAKDFETAMADLGAGKTTIAKLQEEWRGLGDAILVASKAQENFSKLARAKNFEVWGEGQTSFWGGLAEGLMESVGMGGAQLAAIQRAAYEGKSYEEAMREGNNARRGWHAPIMQFRKDNAYYEAVQRREADRNETARRHREKVAVALSDADLTDEQMERLFEEQTGIAAVASAIRDIADATKSRDEAFLEEVKSTSEANKEAAKTEAEAAKKREAEATKLRTEYESTVKKIASSRLSDAEMERIFADRFGENLTAKEIRELAEMYKTRDERLNDAINASIKAEEDKRKVDESMAKAEEERRKEETELTKFEAAFKDAFTTGGGLIGNASYGLRMEDAADLQLKELSAQTRLAQAAQRTLESINKTLSED